MVSAAGNFGFVELMTASRELMTALRRGNDGRDLADDVRDAALRALTALNARYPATASLRADREATAEPTHP
jgi:hypothetical protein